MQEIKYEWRVLLSWGPREQTNSKQRSTPAFNHYHADRKSLGVNQCFLRTTGLIKHSEYLFESLTSLIEKQTFKYIKLTVAIGHKNAGKMRERELGAWHFLGKKPG